LFGFFGTYLGGNIGHDGGHFAVSRIPFINDLAVWGISLISNPIIWQHQHSFAHHSYTNDHDHDPDLHHFHALMRYTKVQKYFPWHKNQLNPLYIFLSFAFTCYGTCHWNVLRFIFERSLHGTVGWSDRKRFVRTFALFFHSIVYFTVIVIVPFFVHKSSWMALLAGILHMAASGGTFAVFSQVGHVSEYTLDRDITKSKAKRHDLAKVSWAAEQIESTNDFCPHNLLLYIFSAGLSLQIEHHLFPNLNHCHLHHIQPTVEATCKEYNVDYKCYSSFSDTMRDTLKYLNNLGNVNVTTESKKEI
jgi:fatty acid desaturase